MKSNPSITSRQRMEACLEGSIIDRPPVALWRHFPVDDQTPQGLASATLDFQFTFGFDFIKVTPSSSFCLLDWGVEDQWMGAAEGTREYTRRVIDHPEDWVGLRPLDPKKGALADQLACLRLIASGLASREQHTPVIQTIFNPLSQAKNLVGRGDLLVHLRRYPEALHAGLRTITQSTRRFIEAAQDTGIAGVFFAVQHASYLLLSEDEYLEFDRAYDLEVLEAARNLWFNLLHLHGEEVMFEQFLDYPVQAINWHDRDTPPSLGEALKVYPGVVCGGLQREKSLVQGSPETVTSEALDALRQTGGERFILGTGCVVPVTAPRANILAARNSVELDF